jgi:hypothetical protein
MNPDHPDECEWGRSLYIMQMGGTGAFKIGRSGDPENRRKQLQTGCPHSIRLLLVIPDMGHREREVHRRMARHKTRSYSGEWFHESGWGDLPFWIANQISEHVLEMVNSEWWREEATHRPLGPS